MDNEVKQHMNVLIEHYSEIPIDVLQNIVEEAYNKWPIGKYGWIGNGLRNKFIEAAIFGVEALKKYLRIS